MVNFNYPSCSIVHGMFRSISVVIYELGHNTTFLTKTLELARYLCVLQIDESEYVYFKFQNAQLGTSDSAILVVGAPVMRAILGKSAKIDFGEIHHTDAQIDAIVGDWYDTTSTGERNDYDFVMYMVSKLLPPKQRLRDKLNALNEFNRLRKFQKRFNPNAKGHSAASKCWSLLCWLPPFFNLLYIGPCLLVRKYQYRYPDKSILDMIDDIPDSTLICVDYNGIRRQCMDEQLRSFRRRS